MRQLLNVDVWFPPSSVQQLVGAESQSLSLKEEFSVVSELLFILFRPPVHPTHTNVKAAKENYREIQPATVSEV